MAAQNDNPCIVTLSQIRCELTAQNLSAVAFCSLPQVCLQFDSSPHKKTCSNSIPLQRSVGQVQELCYQPHAQHTPNQVQEMMLLEAI